MLLYVCILHVHVLCRAFCSIDVIIHCSILNDRNVSMVGMDAVFEVAPEYFKRPPSGHTLHN